MIPTETVAIFIPITFIIVVAIIVKIVSDNRTRRIAIEKGMVNENIKYLYFDRYESHIPSALKWGIILIAVGIAIYVAQFIDQVFPYSMSGEITFGTMLVFAGLGLIVYYTIAVKLVNKNKEDISEIDKIE